MVLVAYNAHYSSKYLQTFTLHHISTNCSSINKGTIPEVLANIVFIFSTAPSSLVRSRSSAVSRLAQTLLLFQFSKGAFLLSLSHAICSSARLMRLGCAGPQWAEQLELCCPTLPACRVHTPHPLLWVRTAGSLLLNPCHKEETGRLFASCRISAWCQTHLSVQLNTN